MDVIDRIRALLKLPLAIYTILRTLYQDYSALLARSRAPPGLPVPDPTSAFWQDHPPYPDLVNIQSPGGPPRTADIVIIGSGITGLAIARTVLHELHRKGELLLVPQAAQGRQQHHQAPDGSGPRREWVRVLVLEARQLCSGATGRNGGHIKASPHELFHQLTTIKKMDPARAAALCAFQISHVQMLKEVVQAEGIEDVSEFREVQTVDFAVEEDTSSRMKAQMADFTAAYRHHVNDKGYVMQAHSGEEARALFGVNERVAGALSYPAGALWPYRFVTALWKQLLHRFDDSSLAIETGTAVTSVQISSTDDDDDDDALTMPYVVSTSRGPIRARHVVHATNGFASQLLPALAGKAAGVRCHMTAQRPGTNFPKTNGTRSYSVIYGSGFDYITQRPSRPSAADSDENEEEGGGDELMIGGGLFQSGKQGMDMFGDYDDRKLDAMTLMHLEGVMPTIFHWGAEAPGKSRMIKAWSGVVGFSGDVMPLVGRLDPRITKRAVKKKNNNSNQTTITNASSSKLPLIEKRRAPAVEPGEWIAAYFCGDGMVWAWLCGSALGIMLAGSEHEDLPKEPGRPAGRLVDWFPPELLPSWGRVQSLDISDLVDEL